MNRRFEPVQTNTIPSKDKILNLIWKVVCFFFFKHTPYVTSIFRKWRVVLLRFFGAKVSTTASIHPKARIDYPWRLCVGDRSSIGAHSWVYCIEEIAIGEKSCIGEDVYLLTGSHDISSSDFHLVTKPITIGNAVWVATRSILLPGVQLSDLSVVAAGSVVTKSTLECDVVGGNPAKFIKKREIKD